MHPNIRFKSRNNVEVNCGPRSVVMVAGTPKFEIHPSIKVFATFSEDVSLIGIASGHLVNLSTHVKRCVWPFDGGDGPTISTCMCLNRASGTANVHGVVEVCL